MPEETFLGYKGSVEITLPDPVEANPARGNEIDIEDVPSEQLAYVTPGEQVIASPMEIGRRQRALQEQDRSRLGSGNKKQDAPVFVEEIILPGIAGPEEEG